VSEQMIDTPQGEPVAHLNAATHMDVHTSLSDGDHGHAEQPLGPIDWQKWAFALAGAISGLIVLLFFYAGIS